MMSSSKNIKQCVDILEKLCFVNDDINVKPSVKHENIVNFKDFSNKLMDILAKDPEKYRETILHVVKLRCKGCMCYTIKDMYKARCVFLSYLYSYGDVHNGDLLCKDLENNIDKDPDFNNMLNIAKSYRK